MAEVSDEVKRIVLQYIKAPMKAEYDRLEREKAKLVALHQTAVAQQQALKAKWDTIKAEIEDPPEPEPEPEP